MAPPLLRLTSEMDLQKVGISQLQRRSYATFDRFGTAGRATTGWSVRVSMSEREQCVCVGLQSCIIC